MIMKEKEKEQCGGELSSSHIQEIKYFQPETIAKEYVVSHS